MQELRFAAGQMRILSSVVFLEARFMVVLSCQIAGAVRVVSCAVYFKAARECQWFAFPPPIGSCSWLCTSSGTFFQPVANPSK